MKHILILISIIISNSAFSMGGCTVIDIQDFYSNIKMPHENELHYFNEWKQDSKLKEKLGYKYFRITGWSGRMGHYADIESCPEKMTFELSQGSGALKRTFRGIEELESPNRIYGDKLCIYDSTRYKMAFACYSGDF
jgi:hypothetical protein